MQKTTLMRTELEGVLLDALRQNPVTADISAVEIVVDGPDVDEAVTERLPHACDWHVGRARRGGGAFFDGALDAPVETDDHRVDATDAAVRAALDEVVTSLRGRYAVSP